MRPRLLSAGILIILTIATGWSKDNAISTVKSVLLSPVEATLTGEQINWQVIASGGGPGISPNYRLHGTIGQTAVGLSGSANYNLNSGFWQSFGSAGCCLDPRRGDINYTGAYPAEIDISDLVYLVDYMFVGGAEPICLDETDVNGLGDAPYTVNIADLVYLVDFMFAGGPEPIACP